MNNYKKAFVDYYNEHNISPVSQDISDIKKHFERREALFRHCGIPPTLVSGKTVLEVGPGTGQNAIFTNSLKPKKFVLVDGCSKSIQETTKNLSFHFDAYATSPHFITDWRWYKDIHGGNKNYNRTAIGSYRKNIHSLLDYRYTFEPISPAEIENIETNADSIFKLSLELQYEIKEKHLSDLIHSLNNLSGSVAAFSKETSSAINEFKCAAESFYTTSTFPLEMPQFEKWFGRGQQYVCFIKKS